MHPRISIRGSVRLSVRPLVCSSRFLEKNRENLYKPQSSHTLFVRYFDTLDTIYTNSMVPFFIFLFHVKVPHVLIYIHLYKYIQKHMEFDLFVFLLAKFIYITLAQLAPR